MIRGRVEGPRAGLAGSGTMTERDRGRGLGGWTLAAVLAGYLAAVLVATDPVVRTFGSKLPAPGADPITHLWTLRWSTDQLARGRLPLFNPDAQIPVGVPLGLMPPLHLQTLIFAPVALATGNDVLAYNTAWLFGFLFTGIGTFVLAWTVLRDRLAAAFAGLAAMLSTPMMLHAQAHIELIQVGGVALFLAAWLRFVDRPGRGRLAAAVGAYWLMTMGAAYFAVLAIVPAGLYVLVRALRARRLRAWGWLRHRAAWLSAFGAIAVVGLAVLFAAQIEARLAGYPMTRSRADFETLRVPLWGYVVPTTWQRLSAVFPFETYVTAGYDLIECPAYLGLAVLALMHRAAVRRAALPRARFWWAALGVMGVLSLGAVWTVGSYRVPMPAGWLWDTVPLVRLTRVPARFNLLVVVAAAVIAGAGLKDLLRSRRRAWARGAVFGALAAVVAFDTPLAGFHPEPLRPAPAAYRAIAARKPGARVLDAPLIFSGAPHTLNALSGYWQATGRHRTTGGYTAHANNAFDNLMVHTSPFHALRLADANYMSDPEHMDFDLVRGVRFLDYTWLYLTAHGVDDVVLHRGPGSYPELGVKLERLEAAMEPACVTKEDTAIHYDRRRLEPPRRAVWLPTEGWRQFEGRPGAARFAALGRAELALYCPEKGPQGAVRLGFRGRSLLERRTVRLVVDGHERARWTVRPGATADVLSPPLVLGAGLHSVVLASDGVARPRHRLQRIADGDATPYAIQVEELRLEPMALGTWARKDGQAIPSPLGSWARKEAAGPGPRR